MHATVLKIRRDSLDSIDSHLLRPSVKLRVRDPGFNLAYGGKKIRGIQIVDSSARSSLKALSVIRTGNRSPLATPTNSHTPFSSFSFPRLTAYSSFTNGCRNCPDMTDIPVLDDSYPLLATTKKVG